MTTFPFSGLDRLLERTTRPLARGRLGAGFRALTHLGDGLLWWGVCGCALLFGRPFSPALAGVVLAGEVAALALLIPLRYAVRRRRPDRAYRPSRLAPWNLYSFPSQHALRVSMLATLLRGAYPQAGAWLWLLAAAVALSRVVLRRHYLTDVLAGASLGAAIGAACRALGA